MRRGARPGAEVDPRVARSHQTILRAALEELGDVGYGAFTMESVAARAGVGKSTIYRHWPSKLPLIEAAFRTLHEQTAPDIVTGSPRERVERILRYVAEVVSRKPFSSCLPALIDGAERNRDVRRFHHRFQREARRPLVAVIASGVASGDLPSHVNPELAATALVGAIIYRRLMTSEPFRAVHASDLVVTILGE
jgi:TetR/AcrR family transcriptional regulator of autoinduction and epiphytic fitness